MEAPPPSPISQAYRFGPWDAQPGGWLSATFCIHELWLIVGGGDRKCPSHPGSRANWTLLSRHRWLFHHRDSNSWSLDDYFCQNEQTKKFKNTPTTIVTLARVWFCSPANLSAQTRLNIPLGKTFKIWIWGFFFFKQHMVTQMTLVRPAGICTSKLKNVATPLLGNTLRLNTAA